MFSLRTVDSIGWFATHCDRTDQDASLDQEGNRADAIARRLDPRARTIVRPEQQSFSRRTDLVIDVAYIEAKGDARNEFVRSAATHLIRFYVVASIIVDANNI